MLVVLSTTRRRCPCIWRRQVALSQATSANVLVSEWEYRIYGGLVSRLLGFAYHFFWPLPRAQWRGCCPWHWREPGWREARFWQVFARLPSTGCSSLPEGCTPLRLSLFPRVGARVCATVAQWHGWGKVSAWRCTTAESTPDPCRWQCNLVSSIV